ncbi:MAG TPA: molybdopterin biosynthesis protein [Negativicutes bacterium]|nr:molybdopterin biosynthesis protein [Negativicutes bacterium]
MFELNKHDRSIYISNMDVNEAKRLLMERTGEYLGEATSESIPVLESQDRISAEPVFARVSSPNFNASAMDGIAVRAKSTFGASETSPMRLFKGTDFIYVDTGDPIMDPYDAVIMIEDVVEIDSDTVEIIKAVSPWQDVRPIGEDIVANEMIIPVNHKIRPVDIAAMLSGGIRELQVVKKPRVGIIPTGTEIIEPDEPLELGKIIESNSRMFEGLVREYGGEPARFKPVPDDYELLKNTIIRAVKENDMVIINAGSSAGSEDFTVKLVAELGEVLVHGIATKPGKPAILGIIEGKPVIGIPGYPVSAYFVFETFAKPLISRYLRQETMPKPKAEAVLSRRLVSSLKHTEYVRIKLGMVEDKLIATPLSRGAGATMSLVRADGILTIPRNSEGIEAGERVQIELTRSIEDINNTIVSIGSHDLIMDMIGSLIHRKDSRYSLSSAHVGSMGGLMALRRGEAHLAPIHLLDEETGIYNESYIRKLLPGKEIVLVKGVKRVQGLMVKGGNPKAIKGFRDFTREDIQFVNRQKGAGTRILADYMLKREGIAPEAISGYEREMTTHMAVAAAVSSGSADVGVGVLSAAKAMELDFIPIGVEEYDFAVPEKYLGLDMFRQFIDIIESPEFSEILRELGGYEADDIGRIVHI